MSTYLVSFEDKSIIFYILHALYNLIFIIFPDYIHELKKQEYKDKV